MIGNIPPHFSDCLQKYAKLIQTYRVVIRFFLVWESILLFLTCYVFFDNWVTNPLLEILGSILDTEVHPLFLGGASEDGAHCYRLIVTLQMILGDALSHLPMSFTCRMFTYVRNTQVISIILWPLSWCSQDHYCSIIIVYCNVLYW